MKIWEIDLYPYSSRQQNLESDVVLLIKDERDRLFYEAFYKSNLLKEEWLIEQLKLAAQGSLPDKIKIFRSDIVPLFTVVTKSLGIKLEATRRTPIVKKTIARYTDTRLLKDNPKSYLKLNFPPPQPLPENIMGENWNFVSMNAQDLINFTQDRPIPICHINESLLPINLNISSTTTIPGIVVYGGKKSMLLARWLLKEEAIAINYIPTEQNKAGGLILESGLVSRWIFATFEDSKIAKAGTIYEERKNHSKGLHFLLIQPDDSGMTHTGLWLLKDE